jgi:hypothetical protein
MDKEKYLLAKANGLEERFRGDEISRRIAKEYPLSAQIALLMDKDLKYDEWVTYQAFRQRVKEEVNAEIAQWQYEF